MPQPIDRWRRNPAGRLRLHLMRGRSSLTGCGVSCSLPARNTTTNVADLAGSARGSQFALRRRRFRAAFRSDAVGRGWGSGGPAGFRSTAAGAVPALGEVRERRVRRRRRLGRLPLDVPSSSSAAGGAPIGVGDSGSGLRPSGRISKPINRSILRSIDRSAGLHREIAIPVAPARPVRPMRCT